MSDALTHEEVTALYRRYGFFLRRRCALLVRDAALADDAMQEAFVRVMRSGSLLRHSDQAARFDAKPTDGWILAGRPDDVERARATRVFAGVAVLPIASAP